MKLFLLLISAAIFFECTAQSEPKAAINFGLEVDGLPYATGGYFGAAWVGKDKWRVRALTAFVRKPDFTTRSGFVNHQVEAYALLVDRFLKDDWKGWCIGGGVVHWSSTIQAESRINTGKLRNVLLNGSLGYNFTLYKHLYLSPWAGMSIRVAGNKDVVVDAKRYTLPLLNPEASLKIGYYF